MRAVFIMFIFAFGLFLSPQVFSEPAGRDLMAMNFINEKISAFTGDSNMILINSSGQERTRNLQVWSKTTEAERVHTDVMSKFVSPADIKGTGFLQVEHVSENGHAGDEDDDVWIYLPALGKVRRILANNKGDSYFGTDFSYVDIIAAQVDDYTHRYLRTEKLNDTDYYVVESVPASTKLRNDTGYSKKITWMDMENSLEYQVEYYDLSGQLLKTQKIYDYVQLNPNKKRWIASRREMTNHQTGHRTLYQWKNLKIKDKFADDFFTVRTLEK